MLAPGLFSLDLTNNFIDGQGIIILCSMLFKVDNKPMD